jgi:hypothetical protein
MLKIGKITKNEKKKEKEKKKELIAKSIPTSPRKCFKINRTLF